jgi:hypothetical protein
VACAYVGTRLFGDRPSSLLHTPDQQLDLRSLVRTAFCLSKQRIPAIKDDDEAVGQHSTGIT